MGIVGSIRKKSLLGRETTEDLPEELPMEMGVFIWWLVTIMRQQDDSAAAEPGMPLRQVSEAVATASIKEGFHDERP